MARQVFTDEVVSELKQNPYTLSVNNNRLSLTLEAKEKILEMDERGMPWRHIVEELGYDPNVLGKYRARNMVRNVRRDVNSPYGVHEGYIRTARKRLGKDDIKQLDNSPASYARLKNEVIYLQEEVELLKKISRQVITGKRGK